MDVAGVGYEVEIPLSTACHLAVEGEDASLWIYTHVREDALRLFGFASRFDKRVFEALLSVSSVGPKSALGLLGPFTGAELCEALVAGDLRTLVSIPGVGMKTAERLVLELKIKAQKLLADGGEGRVGAVASQRTHAAETAHGYHRVMEDLRSALTNLGYKDKQVNELVAEYEERGRGGEALSIEVVLREALRKLSGRVLSTF